MVDTALYRVLLYAWYAPLHSPDNGILLGTDKRGCCVSRMSRMALLCCHSGIRRLLHHDLLDPEISIPSLVGLA